MKKNSLLIFAIAIGVCVSFDHTIYSEPFIYDKHSVILGFHSIYWSVGIKLIIDGIYNAATRIITAKPYSAEFHLELIEKYRVNISFGSPFHMVACLKNDKINKMNLSSVKNLLFHGSKVASSLVAELNHYFPNATLVSNYGMTEIGHISECYHNVQENIGGNEVSDGCLVKIVDDDENPCAANTIGEIRIKKKYKFPGYLDDPEATAAAIDEEGFFRTGDIGHFDENGLLFVGDREKDVIKVFHFRGVILPSDIEKRLIAMSDIKEVCVVGIPIAPAAQIPAAVVVRKPHSLVTQRDVYDVVAGEILYFPNLLLIVLF